MQCFQVQYNNEGQTWLADVTLFTEHIMFNSRMAAIIKILKQKFGHITNAKIIKEYK